MYMSTVFFEIYKAKLARCCAESLAVDSILNSAVFAGVYIRVLIVVVGIYNGHAAF